MRIFILTICFFIGLVIPFISFGATVFEDPFNAYSNGNLNGQGSWSGDTDIDVGSTVIFEGTRAVFSNTSDNTDNLIVKVGSDTPTGLIGVYMRTNDANYDEGMFRILDGSSYAGAVYFNSSGNIQYLKTGGWFTYQAYSADVWYFIQIEWRSSDFKVRFQVDSNGWTDWFVSYQSWSSIDTVGLSVHNADAGDEFYFDYISEFAYTEEEEESVFGSYLTDPEDIFNSYGIIIISFVGGLFIGRKL